MSSIRSLATITLLAGVGIILYLKINETEPVLPAEVEGLQLGEIQFDDQPSPFGGQASAPTATPQFGAAIPGEAAPEFVPSAEAPPAGEPAPAWNNSQTIEASSAPAFDPSANESSVATGAPEVPPLPALPASAAPPAGEQPAPAEPQDLAPPPIATESAPPTPPEVSAASEPAPTTPTPETTAQGQSSLFSATRLAVESALDRGELSQALLLLSDWYDDPSLSAADSQQVNQLLRQLAGTVIYSTEHRLEPPYMVQAGEQLPDIAQKYQVPWQLLAKINGISPGDQLQPGQQLKVVRGPFSALIDLGRRKMTLMLDRRYAGQFSLDVDPSSTVEEGHWSVNQKLLTPGNVGSADTPAEEQSLMLSRADGSTNQLTIIRGSNASTPTAAEPTGRVLRLDSQEVGDVYDILSLGSRVVIRR